MESAEVLALIGGHVEEEILLRNEYLAAENEILKSEIEGRPRLTAGGPVTVYVFFSDATVFRTVRIFRPYEYDRTSEASRAALSSAVLHASTRSQ